MPHWYGRNCNTWQIWLPLRGIVDENFINAAQMEVAPDEEYMFVIDCKREDNDPRMEGGFGIGHSNIREDLKDWIGAQAAFGQCPNFIVGDHESMVSFSKGGIDGAR